jgi:hypothetical protein
MNQHDLDGAFGKIPNIFFGVAIMMIGAQTFLTFHCRCLVSFLLHAWLSHNVVICRRVKSKELNLQTHNLDPRVFTVHFLQAIQYTESSTLEVTLSFRTAFYPTGFF